MSEFKIENLTCIKEHFKTYTQESRDQTLAEHNMIYVDSICFVKNRNRVAVDKSFRNQEMREKAFIERNNFSNAFYLTALAAGQLCSYEESY